jgi:hypothetical protein
VSPATHHPSAFAPEGEAPTKESGRGMHASTAETPERGSKVTTTILPVQAAATDFRTPIDVSSFHVRYDYSDAQFGRSDGARFPFAVKILPSESTLLVTYLAGATEGDAAAAEHLITQLRSGTSPFRFDNYLALAGTTDEGEGDLLVPCRAAGCDEFGRHHADDNLSGDTVVHRTAIAERAEWVVEACRGNDVSDPWKIHVEVSPFDITPLLGARLASDLQRASVAAMELNENAAGQS